MCRLQGLLVYELGITEETFHALHQTELIVHVAARIPPFIDIFVPLLKTVLLFDQKANNELLNHTCPIPVPLL